MKSVLFTKVSGNSKVGPLSTVMSVQSTCPTVCPLHPVNGGACYAAGGPSLIHWDRLTKGLVGMLWADFLKAVRKDIYSDQLWRWGTAGDLPGTGNVTDAVALAELTKANQGRKGWAYTHRPVLSEQTAQGVSTEAIAANRVAIKAANDGGFTVNLSANNLGMADKLLALGIAPVVSIVPKDVVKNCLTPGGNRVVICPASTRDNVTCARCGLCQRAKRDYVIAFPAHGFRIAKANAVALAA